MSVTQNPLDKKMARVSAWLAGASTRRSWLARLGAALFGGYAIQGGSDAFGAVDLCGSVPVGCVQGDGDGWLSHADGCKDTATRLVWSHQQQCVHGGVSYGYAKNTACPGIGMTLPSRAQVVTALQHNFVAHNDNRNGQGMNGQNWTIDTKPPGKRAYTYRPSAGPNQTFVLEPSATSYINAFCVKQE